MGGTTPEVDRKARLRARLRSFVTARDADGESLVAASPALAVRDLLRRFWPHARPYRRWIPLGLASIAVGAAAVTAEIWLFGLVIDQVVVPGELGPLVPIAIAYLALALISGLASFGEDYVGTYVGERFILDLRTDLFDHLQHLSPDDLGRRRLGDLLSRVSGDVAAIEGFILAGLADALGALLRILLFSGALLLLDWRLALVSFVVAPLFWLAARKLITLIKEASREKRRRSGSMTAVAEQALGNSMLVAASNRERYERERMRREGEGAVQAELASSRIHGLLTPLVDLIELAAAMLVITLGTLAVAEGSLTLGGLLAFVTYLGKLYGPVRDLTAVGESVFAAAAGAERVSELLDARPAVSDRPGARRIGTARGEIELDSVGFGYPGGDRPVLDGASATIRPRETVAVVGASGAGKSTLVKLLLRFCDPDRGSVRLDGNDLRDVEIASLRRNVSVLLQEAPILHGTVRENIGYGAPAAGDAEILAAAEAVGARDLIRSLPDGLDTQLGERGARLSGGQRQRIAMARCLLDAAPVLILDEPGTGLDEESRERLLEPLTRLARGRTTILITHDPRFARIAGRELRLEDGLLLERGRREEVVAA